MKLFTKINFLCIIITLSFTQTVFAQIFQDVPNTYPYFTAIETLANQNIINGYPDGNFQPDKAVNRVETLKILLLSAKIEVSDKKGNAGFPDVISDAWYSKYVLKAKKEGIVKGNPDGHFYPENQVNLAEALKMICLSNQISLSNNLNEKPYLDIPKESWYAPYFSYAKSQGILTTNSNVNIYPAKPLSRGELSNLIYRFQNPSITTTHTGSTNQKATYYADIFQGKTTASGDIFDQEKYTAAHRTLPFGTKVKVTNQENNKAVIVTINDRGPYGHDDYVLDLSRSAFEAIAPLSRGVISINYEVVLSTTNSKQTNETNLSGIESKTKINQTTECQTNLYPRETISSHYYAGIELSNNLPTIFQKNEVFHFQGKSTKSNLETITVFLINTKDETEKIHFSGEIQEDKFDIPVLFNQIGTYNLGILAGTSGSSYIKEIQVIDSDCLKQETSISLAPSDLKLELQNNQTILMWNNQGQPLSKIEFWQADQKETFFVNNAIGSFEIPFQYFSNFNLGKVFYRVSGAKSTSNFSIDRNSKWTSSTEQYFIATQHQERFNVDSKIESKQIPETFIPNQKLTISGKISDNIVETASLITPDGNVINLPIESSATKITNKQTGESYFPAHSSFKINYTPKSSGTYILEINSKEGFAIINQPLYQRGSFPFLPDFWDLKEHFLDESKKIINLEKSRSELLNLINQERLKYNLSKVILDENLDNLAQARADDMQINNYFAHQNLTGEYVNDLKNNYNLKTNIAENIAKDVSLEFGHAGLMRSAIHRANILNPKWTRVGLGLSQNQEGYFILVEEFAEDELQSSDLENLKTKLLNEINNIKNINFTLIPSLEKIAQTWSETIQDKANSWFEDNETGLSLSFLISRDYDNVQSASTILKGDFQSILEKTVENETLLEDRWQKIGLGITQNNDGSLNTTLIYSQ